MLIISSTTTRIAFLLVLFLFTLKINSQSDELNKTVFKYLIEFKEKNNPNFTIKSPEYYLSEKAIQRRKKYNIQITNSDLPVNPLDYEKIRQLSGVKILLTSKWFNAVLIECNDSNLAKSIKDFLNVKSVKLMGAWSIKSNSNELKKDNIGESINNKKIVNKKLETSDYYGQAWYQTKMLNGNKLHDLGFNGEGIRIAVLDAGFMNLDQIDFFDPLLNEGRVLGIKDFVKFDNSVFEDDNHGLNVLSCMAADIPGNFVGTAPKASYYLLRSEEAATEFPVEEINWAAAAEFADSAGADVINSSLGYTNFDIESMSHTRTSLDGTNFVSRAADFAESKGILVVNSAGNEGSNAWHYISSPADAKNVLAIGAVDKDEEIAWFSSKGPSFDNRIKPDVCSMGENVNVVSPMGNVNEASGTSFAGPILCGMAACLLQAHPDKSPSELRNAIKQSADKGLIPDSTFGYGLPDFYIAHLMLSGFNSDTSFILNKNWIEQVKPKIKIFIPANSQASVCIFKGKRKLIFEAKNITFASSFRTIELPKDLKQGKYTLKFVPAKGKKYAITFQIDKMGKYKSL